MTLNVNVNHYFHGGSSDKEAIAELARKIDYVINQNKIIMATKQEQYDAIIARLDTITNNIAADYKKLLDEIANGTVSQESLDKGVANVERLEAIGAQVDNPVPEPPTA